MTVTLDFESDQFLQLLTDALRAGPGSPSWHAVIGKLREDGAITDAPLETQGEQLQALIAVRENLESGRSYRSVRAGPGFRRRVMAQIDAESETAKIPGPTTGWVAGASIILGLTILVILGYFLLSGPHAADTGADGLASRYFSQTAAAANFDGKVPDGWSPIGQLPLSFDHAMTPLASQGKLPAGGGGIVMAQALPAQTAAALEVTLTLGRGDDLIPQVFVSDSPDFSADKGASAHELACFIEHRIPQAALPDGTLAGHAVAIADPYQPLTVRIVLDQQNAIIQCGGRVVWSGQNQLSQTAPRYFGVRHLHSVAGGRDRMAAVLSARVMQ
jgi:hypothetical protein